MAEAPSLNHYLALAAHDLKQPLNVLQMYLGILQRRAHSKTGDELGAVVSVAMRSVQSTLSLLPQWARAEQQQLKQTPSVTPSTAWCATAERLKGVTIATACPQTEPVSERMIDLDFIQQILQEMIHLLPQPVQITAVNHTWELEIETPLLITPNSEREAHYTDALYELSISAGQAILSQLGVALSCRHDSDKACSRLHLKVA